MKDDLWFLTSSSAYHELPHNWHVWDIQLKAAAEIVKAWRFPNEHRFTEEHRSVLFKKCLSTKHFTNIKAIHPTTAPSHRLCPLYTKISTKREIVEKYALLPKTPSESSGFDLSHSFHTGQESLLHCTSFNLQFLSLLISLPTLKY